MTELDVRLLRGRSQYRLLSYESVHRDVLHQQVRSPPGPITLPATQVVPTSLRSQLREFRRSLAAASACQTG